MNDITKNGGKPVKHDLAYSPPKGPTSQGHEGPGLGGTNYGNGNGFNKSGGQSGSPGLGGSNHGIGNGYNK